MLINTSRYDVLGPIISQFFLSFCDEPVIRALVRAYIVIPCLTGHFNVALVLFCCDCGSLLIE